MSSRRMEKLKGWRRGSVVSHSEFERCQVRCSLCTSSSNHAAPETSKLQLANLCIHRRLFLSSGNSTFSSRLTHCSVPRLQHQPSLLFSITFAT